MKVLVLVKKITAIAVAAVLLFCGFSFGYYFGSTERGGIVTLKPDHAVGFPLEKAEDVTKILNLNTADVNELTTLPGIGEKLASAIVSFRDENGAFSTVWELTAVEGIGEGKLEKLAPYLTVE